jgi:hypothetical protein
MKINTKYFSSLTVNSQLAMLSVLFVCCLSTLSCAKFLEVDVPKSNIEKSVVFSDDASAEGAVRGIYNTLYSGVGQSGTPFASGRHDALSSLAGLAADELIHPANTNESLIQFVKNQVNPFNAYNSDLWTSPYRAIYQTNIIIENVTDNPSITASLRNQLIGEAYFIRAFCYFYLTQLFGDVPLVLTTDYTVNATIRKTPKPAVLANILNDLLKSYGLLSEHYVAYQGERIRVNKSTASAMLSRYYLYMKDWSKAEMYASEVISKASTYKLLPDVKDVFLKNSAEAIWQLRPSTQLGEDDGATNEGMNFSPDDAPKYNLCSNELLLSFENNDARYADWILPFSDGIKTYYTPHKYKHYDYNEPMTEYSMVFRLAELYLIRAESRAMLNNLVGANSAQSDIDSIRIRAHLLPTTATSQADLLAAIRQERRVELFTEWGHRWFDLIRWEKSTEVLAPVKGAGWQTTDVLLPIPQEELNANVYLKPQNKGY